MDPLLINMMVGSLLSFLCLILSPRVNSGVILSFTKVSDRYSQFTRHRMLIIFFKRGPIPSASSDVFWLVFELRNG